MKLIIYELNEIPRRLVDYYIETFPKSYLALICQEGIIMNTFTKDSGELHPWSTWPTVHRGVYNDLHNIRSINQDLSFSKKYPPKKQAKKLQLVDGQKVFNLVRSLKCLLINFQNKK